MTISRLRILQIDVNDPVAIGDHYCRGFNVGDLRTLKPNAISKLILDFVGYPNEGAR